MFRGVKRHPQRRNGQAAYLEYCNCNILIVSGSIPATILDYRFGAAYFRHALLVKALIEDSDKHDGSSKIARAREP